MGVSSDRDSLYAGLIALVWRQQVGNSIRNGIVDITLGAVERAGNYLCFVFFVNAEGKFPIAYRADQDIHKVTFHGCIIPRLYFTEILMVDTYKHIELYKIVSIAFL